MGVVDKPLQKIIEGHRVSDIKALAQIAVVRDEEGKLFLSFDAFCNNGNIQAMPHGYDRHDHSRVSRIAGHIADEGLIDLELANREAL